MPSKEVRTPERDLLFAVIMASIEDLTSKNEQDKFDAHEFWFQPKGPWAENRRMLLGATGLDEDAMVEGVQHLFDPPEREKRNVTAEHFYHAMPDHPVKAGPFGKTWGLSYSQSATRVHQLVKQGVVVSTGHGQFIRVDAHDSWVASRALKTEPPTKPAPKAKPVTKPKPPAKANPRPQILATLTDGPKTIREIGHIMHGDFGDAPIRNALMEAVNDGRVEYSTPYWTLKEAM